MQVAKLALHNNKRDLRLEKKLAKKHSLKTFCIKFVIITYIL